MVMPPFRDLLVAASLKLVLDGRFSIIVAAFRDLLVAASLKQPVDQSVVPPIPELSAIFLSRPH